MSFSNHSGAPPFDRASFEAAMRAMVADQGSPLERRGETVVARAVPSWAPVRYLAVAPDMAGVEPFDVVPESVQQERPSLGFRIDVIVVPWLSPGAAVPLDAEMCPVAPPGEWRGKPPAPVERMA